MSSIEKKLGQRIAELRKTARLTQFELAEAANIGNDFVSRIERGDRTPSLKVLEQIAEALNVEAKDLFNFDVDKNKNRFDNQPLLKLNLLLKNKKPEEIKLIFDISKKILGKK